MAISPPCSPSASIMATAASFAAAVIIGGDLRHDFHARLVARNIDGEDRNAGGVRLLNDRHNRLRITRTENDGGHLLDDEILDLIALLGDIFLAADDDGIVAMFFAFDGNVVADDFEKRIVEREQGDANRALGFGRGLVAFPATANR